MGVKSDYEMNPLGPLSKETDSTYGGAKPGKAPTPKPPAMPDPFKLIDAQADSNRVNEVGPSGTLTWSQGPDGKWTQTRAFSPELQKIYGKQLGLLNQDAPTGDAYNQKYSDAMFSRSRALLDPMFDQQSRTMEQKLANQGLPMGSEAYTGELDRFEDTRNRAYTDAANQATLSGTDVGMRQRGTDMQGRSNEFNQMAALLGGQQTNQGSPLDVMGPFGMQQEGQMNQYQGALANSQAQNAQKTQGATALASMLAMIFMCWVAEALYGREAERTRVIRFYVMEHWADETLFGRFCRLYHKHGIKWAAWVRRWRPVRAIARVCFDLLYKRAKRSTWPG